MTPIPKTLIGLLEIKDPFVNRLRNSILKSFDSMEDFKAALYEQCENRRQTHCYSCNNEGICLFLNGVLNFKLGSLPIAISELETAAQHFRGRGEEWNHVLGQVMLGCVFEADGKDHLALRKYQKALEALAKDYIRMHPTEYMEKASILKNLLHDQLEGCFTQEKKARTRRSVKNTARLTIPWTPKYSGLYASPQGPTLTESFSKEGSVYIHEIVLEGKPHRIYSLKQGDNLVALIKDRKYSWAKVFGDSMNAARPVAIVENDFVLYHESSGAEHGAIVVAYCPDKSGSGYQLIVKRYSKTNRWLTSETDPPGRYEPIPLSGDVKIMGTAIAVAKFSGEGDGEEMETP